jgi:hypothetical protein
MDAVLGYHHALHAGVYEIVAWQIVEAILLLNWF